MIIIASIKKMIFYNSRLVMYLCNLIYISINSIAFLELEILSDSINSQNLLFIELKEFIELYIKSF